MIADVTAFGAVGDGATLNTAAIQSAVDACTEAGGGTVVVPPGVFLTGTVFLRSRLTFHLEAGAVLLGSPNIDDYCADDAYCQNWPCPAEGWRGAHILVAVGAEDVQVTGPGAVDGNAEAYLEREAHFDGADWLGGFSWARGYRNNAPEKMPYRPGQMLVFVQCRRVRVTDLTLRNSPCWSCFLHGCREAVVRGLFIDNPVDGANSDGIDIDCCSQVTVSDCVIRTGDDAITLRASGRKIPDVPAVCEDVAITNCVLDTSVCGFRIGVGNGLIRNATISNIVLRHAGRGFLLQSSYGKKGLGVTIRALAVSDVRGDHVGHPVCIEAGEGETGDAEIENIRFSDLHIQCAGGLQIHGSDVLRPKDIAFTDCSFTVVRRDHPCDPARMPAYFLDLAAADDVRFRDCELVWRDPEPEWRGTRNIRDVTGFLLDNSRFAGGGLK